MIAVAVVIPTLNSGRTLRRCLVSVLSQESPPSEVVVVDDERTEDDTRQITAELGVRLIVSPAAMAESRNVGVRNTKSQLVLSLDSDMWVAPGLIYKLGETFESREVQAATIGEVSIGSGYWARCRSIDKLSVEATGHGRSIRAYTRRLFNDIGGYDASLEAGEDADFHRRACSAGARLSHISDPQIFHDEGTLRWADIARKKFRYGKSLRAFEAKHGRAIADGYGRRVLVGAKISLRQDPSTLPGFLILKATDLVAGAVGRIDGREQRVK